MERGRRGEPETDALRRLDALRPHYDRLRTERIRAEADVERLTAELDAARAEARAAFGTDDEAALHGIVAEAQAVHDAQVRAFADLVAAIDARLKRLAEGG